MNKCINPFSRTKFLNAYYKYATVVKGNKRSCYYDKNTLGAPLRYVTADIT